MNALLAASPRRDAVAWDRVRFFFGDERSVPPDDAESNYRMNRETLLRAAGHPAPTTSSACAARTSRTPRPRPTRSSWCASSARGRASTCSFLGMGPDGHTASIFPGHAGRDRRHQARRRELGREVQDLAHHAHAARHQRCDARRRSRPAASAKADALHGVLDGPHDPESYPVQLVAPTDGELHWLIDEAAAAKLARRAGAAARSSSASSALSVCVPTLLHVDVVAREVRSRDRVELARPPCSGRSALAARGLRCWRVELPLQHEERRRRAGREAPLLGEQHALPPRRAPRVAAASRYCVSRSV